MKTGIMDKEKGIELLVNDKVEVEVLYWGSINVINRTIEGTIKEGKKGGFVVKEEGGHSYDTDFDAYDAALFKLISRPENKKVSSEN